MIFHGGNKEQRDDQSERDKTVKYCWTGLVIMDAIAINYAFDAFGGIAVQWEMARVSIIYCTVSHRQCIYSNIDLCIMYHAILYIGWHVIVNVKYCWTGLVVITVMDDIAINYAFAWWFGVIAVEKWRGFHPNEPRIYTLHTQYTACARIYICTAAKGLTKNEGLRYSTDMFTSSGFHNNSHTFKLIQLALEFKQLITWVLGNATLSLGW